MTSTSPSARSATRIRRTVPTDRNCAACGAMRPRGNLRWYSESSAQHADALTDPGELEAPLGRPPHGLDTEATVRIEQPRIGNRRMRRATGAGPSGSGGQRHDPHAAAMGARPGRLHQAAAVLGPAADPGCGRRRDRLGQRGRDLLTSVRCLGCFPKEAFRYQRITVERPLRRGWKLADAVVADLLHPKQWTAWLLPPKCKTHLCLTNYVGWRTSKAAPGPTFPGARIGRLVGMTNPVETTALTKRYGRVTAVHDLNLTVFPGEVY